MTTRELAELVQRMRKAQKRYFAERTQECLARSKELERQVDLMVDRELGPRAEPSLFDRMEQER